jgi:hypothetical protein
MKIKTQPARNFSNAEMFKGLNCEEKVTFATKTYLPCGNRHSAII